MAHQVSFFDIATRLTGWCSGNGEVRPEVGAFSFPHVGDDYGRLGALFREALGYHFDRFQPVSVGYESPILVPTDTLEKVRKIYGMGVILEAECHERGIPCWERDLRDLKREVTGNPHAEKADIVEVALMAGINLPATKAEGKEDAADAWAGWLIGIRELNPAISARWDSLIWSKGRGSLL